MQVIAAQVDGLQTAPNVLSKTAPGSLALADDCVLAAPGLLQPRRGFASYGGTFGVIADRATSLAAFGGGYLVAYGSSTLAHSISGANFTAYSGAFAPVSTTLARMRFVQAAGNLYCNTAAGTYVQGSLASTPILAGVPQPLAVDNRSTLTMAGDWFTYNTAVAYRATLVRKDANSNVVESAPSGRLVIQNRNVAAVGLMSRTATTVTVPFTNQTGFQFAIGDTFTLSPGEADFPAGLKTVTATGPLQYTEAGAAVANTVEQDLGIDCATSVRVNLPTAATASMWLRLYRSERTSFASDTPSDDLYLVAEQQLTSTNVSDGYVILADAQPEELLGDPLYTDTNEAFGALAAHQPLPVARDLCFWDAQNRMVWANTVEKHRYYLDLLGVGGTTGLQSGDHLYIGGGGVTAGANYFVETSFSPSENVYTTTTNLVRAINEQLLPVYAYYVSGDTDAPGKLLLEERDIGGSAFQVYSDNRPATWNPVLPTSGSSVSQSDNSAMPNGIIYSEPGAPEHVGVNNWLEVGSKSSEILRVVPLRDKLIVFKSDGIYTVSGSQPPFTVQKISEAVIWGADTAVLLSESVFALTNQGVVRVSDAGVVVLSRPVEDQLLPLYGSTLLSDAKKLCFAVGYESSRLYCLWLPTTAGLAAPDVALVYNTSTQAWTRWRRPAPCGILASSVDQLVLARSNANTLAVERKAMSQEDFADEEQQVTIASPSSTTTVLLTGIVACSAGDRLAQGFLAVKSSVITSVSTAGGVTTLTLASLEDWDDGEAHVYPALVNDITFNVLTGGDPVLNKVWQECSFLFQDNQLYALTAGFETEQSLGETTVPCVFSRLGDAPFGVGTFGDSQRAVLRLTNIPKKTGSQMTVHVHIREAQSSWKLAGLVLTAEPVSEKARR